MQKQFGIVLMIDALGVSDYSIEDCEKFLGTQKELKGFLNWLKNTYGKNSDHYKNSHLSVFGDTIIFCCPIDVKNEIPRRPIVDIITDAGRTVAWGIEHGVLFRGCITVGEYICEENTVLGPAIFDANNWYESADWFGVIISPKSQLWFDAIFENDKNKTDDKVMNRFLENFLVHYDVPLSHPKGQQTTEKLWSVGWPSTVYARCIEENALPRAYIRNQLFKIFQSKKGESKFKNGLDFFDWHYERHYESYMKITQIKPRTSK